VRHLIKHIEFIIRKKKYLYPFLILFNNYIKIAMKEQRNYVENPEKLNLDYQKYRSMALNPLLPTKGNISK
jgi:hypothetical protein